MALSYTEIQTKIEALQAKAEAAKAREVGGVIAKIRDAIHFYKLKPEDLFGSGITGAHMTDAIAPILAAKIVDKAPAKKTGKVKKVKKGARPVKYRDGDGNTWIGMGARPEWVHAALAAGKKLEDFLV